jgi:hypothetical protein
MTIEQIWNDIQTTAVLGTERQPVSVPQCDGPLGNLLTQIESPSQEKILLSSATALFLYRKAGQLPAQDSELSITPCDLDDLPVCGERPSQYLMAMLNGQRAEFLTEWLEASAKAGKRAPDIALPQLLDLTKSKPDLRDAIIPVLGKRGQWLASQNPDWCFTNREDDQSLWQTGNRQARMELLTRLRKTNPASARELLLSTWAEETPDDRASFLDTFEAGLSLEDEPLLEEALDDRRKEVRRVAAELLSSLTGSQLTKRMLERVEPLLDFSPGQKGGLFSVNRGPKLNVKMPAECTKEMIRDGIEPKPIPGTGEKSWWLQQMIGAIDPNYWCEKWNTTPSELLDPIRKSEWKVPVMEGWTQAAMRYKNAEWAEALVIARLSDKPRSDQRMIMDIIPPDRREKLVQANLPSDFGLALLYQCTHRWSAGFSRAVLDVFVTRIIKSSSWDRWQMMTVCEAFGRFMHPSIFPGAHSRLSHINNDFLWAAGISKFLDLLEFRHNMLEAM